MASIWGLTVANWKICRKWCLKKYLAHRIQTPILKLRIQVFANYFIYQLEQIQRCRKSSRIFAGIKKEKKQKWTIHYYLPTQNLVASGVSASLHKYLLLFFHQISTIGFMKIQNSGYVCGFKIGCWICNPLLNTNLSQVQTALWFLDNHWRFWPYWYCPEKVSFDIFCNAIWNCWFPNNYDNCALAKSWQIPEAIRGFRVTQICTSELSFWWCN